jgi:hypothetical protein
LTSVAGCLTVHPRSARLPSRCALAPRQPAASRPVDWSMQWCSGWKFYPSSGCTNALWGSCAECPVAELYYRWLLCCDAALSINDVVRRRRVHCTTVVSLLIGSEVSRVCLWSLPGSTQPMEKRKSVKNRPKLIGFEHCNTKNISSRMGIERAAPAVAKPPRRKQQHPPISFVRSPPLPFPNLIHHPPLCTPMNNRQ